MNPQETLPPSGPDPGAPPAGAAGAPGTPGVDLFDRIRGLGVVRPDEGRWAAGVCSGLARRWDLDPLLVRGVFVAMAVVSGIGLGLYALLWLFLPHPDGRIHAQQVLHGVVTPGFLGAGLLLLLDFPVSNSVWSGGGPLNGFTFIVLCGLGAWWLVRRGRRGRGPGPDYGYSYGPQTPTWSGTPSAGSPSPGGQSSGSPSSGTPAYGTPDAAPYGQPPYGQPTYGQGYGYGGGVATAPPRATARAPRRVDTQRPLHAITLATLGAALLAVACVLLWDRQIGRIPGSAAVVAVAAALGVVGLGIVLSGALGRRAGGLAPIAILLAVAAVNGAIWHDTVHGVGSDVLWTPVAAPASTYNLDAGRAVLDLTSAALPVGASAATPVQIPVSIGVGELIVVVPKGSATEVDATVGLGNITDDVNAPGSAGQGGAGLKRTFVYGATPVIKVAASMGLGQIKIVPEGTKVTR
jgi:phage shock protein PspC (stress-responsive transcriptional regulator)